MSAHPVHRTTLDNGLRVVITPDRSMPVVAVAVFYDVGIRTEPEGRTGFAHLFEHLMFQGSAHLEKLAHFRYVQSSGGTFNGSTHLDFTDYYEVLPSNALERALYLEADRMTSPRITEENLANQVAVVEEEIRVNVLNRPYGGFPWLMLPPVLFDTFPNAHDGYGDFADLEAATVEDATAFFRRYYAPSNAVLCVAGDLDVDETQALVERYFGGIAKRRAPKRARLGEPDLAGERRKQNRDERAPLPAVAAAWRTPDPIADLSAYLPFVVLGEVLTDGDASRLEQRLVQQDGTVTQLAAYSGLMGDPFEARDPTAVVFQAMHVPTATADGILDAVGEELDRLVTDGLTPGELDRVRARIAAQLARGLDSVLGRARRVASHTLIHDQPELAWEMPERIAAVTADEVLAAAATLVPDRRAVVEVIAGGVATASEHHSERGAERARSRAKKGGAAS